MSRKAFVIPEISNDYIAQGICYDKESGYFFLTGYQKDDQASPIILVDKETGRRVKTLRMLDPQGNPSINHAGGLSVYGNYVYVSGGFDPAIHVYSRQEILDAKDGEQIRCLGAIPTSSPDGDQLLVSCTTVHDGKLYVSEFYREQNYKTLPSHKIITKGGDYNQSLCLVYNFNEDLEFGLEHMPVAAYSLPDLVQGMCFDDGKIYLSASYGMPAAHIYVYPELGSGQTRTIQVLGRELPLYELDRTNMLEDMKIAPMSEEIEIIDGELYVLTESASNLYIFGKFTSAKYCYATKIRF